MAMAFDSVNHHILIGRLYSLGFSNDCLAWFTNYFSDRAQYVKSEGLLSGPLTVSMGVPQGSILVSRASSSSSEEERREGSEDQNAAWYVFMMKFNKENTEH